MNIEEKIDHFALNMKQELENNRSSKGDISSWKGIQAKVADFEYHKAKLIMAIKEDNQEAIAEFIADCGNILLAIGDEYNLYETPRVNEEKTQKMKGGIFETMNVKDVRPSTNWTFVSTGNRYKE